MAYCPTVYVWYFINIVVINNLLLKTQNMKKTTYFMALFLVLAITFSCSEDFFDKQPIASTSETVFYSQKGVDALLIGTYALLAGAQGGIGDWGATPTNWTYGSVASDDAYKGSDIGDQAPANEIERWSVLTNNGYPNQKWRYVFVGVTRANEALKYLYGSEGIPAPDALRLEAEAKFLRALYNFEGWLVFKNIPIITEETEDPATVPNNVDVLPHIISDLAFAAANLPETQTQVQRPTRYAAMALAARAYMQVLDYANAKPLLDNIIASGKYELVESFHDNFKIETNNNVESIFEIQAAVNDGVSNGSLNGELGLGLNYPHGADIGMCCGFHQPSQNLVNAFKVDANGLPMFDTFNNTDLKNDQGIASSETFVPFDDEVDPRLDWTVSRRGIPYLDWGVNRGRDWIRNQADGGPYMPTVKNFFYQKDRRTLSTTTGWQSGVNANNFRLLRYSHILLWRAEVHVADGELTQAETLVNMIRERAGNEVVMGRVTTYELPPTAYPWNVTIDLTQPAANYRVEEYPTGTFAAEGAAYAMKAVQFEQRLEFATEGMRFFDLRRWDIANPGSMKATLDAFATADRRVREYMAGFTFSERAKLQPIPEHQMNLQPGVLVQNPGY
jgi:starch-binding outer membrane protein, SusD/RagB family